MSLNSQQSGAQMRKLVYYFFSFFAWVNSSLISYGDPQEKDRPRGITNSN
jgi:hypothetical protein